MKFALNERGAVSAAAFLLLAAGPVLADIAPAEWVALYESVPNGRLLIALQCPPGKPRNV
jgi:hypothetical protein